MTPKSRWLAYVLAGALVFVGVAGVAYAVGVANRSNNVAPAAQSTSIPANPGNGQGGFGQGGFGQGGFGQGGNRGQVVPTASGTVTAVGSSSVTINQQGGSTRTLTLTGSTTYTMGGATVGQSALVVGARITARGSADSSGNFTATAVTIQPALVSGTVASKTTSTIVVTTTAGKTVTVNVSSSTKYSVRGVSSATLDSIAVGYTVQAQGTLNADGSLTATIVQAAPNVRQRVPSFGGGGFPGFGGGQTVPTPAASPSGSNL
ncbi:MAG TPA: DUF5666 domain-containing protein [Candidatus Limnocylindrales bacterium]